ncbi:hypothetical protein PRIPAC_72057 [Pristionchus pacificus]|uniref:Protein YIPF n=1 Tax=Pristionchus pacificus TaxID=54126 RepID=A0A2A6CAN9_PRIPA|nr:hypothetical protein PRIPAC_72057 [Pristionchus pacificus]|eukprot:PDM75160.1 hypothetical protein PRIPAC_40541 [Pristionchus pacificus]
MASNYWMGDESQQNNDWGYGQQQQQPANLGWNNFDYSQGPQPPQQQEAPAAPDYYSQFNNYNAPVSNSYSGNMFIPSTAPAAGGASSATYGDDDIENEPPLLEELGINFSHIREKTMVVLNPVAATSVDVIADQDLAGPLVFCLMFGAALLLHGKIQFGFIYGVGMLGCVGVYMLMNLMAGESATISFTCTASVLGYCLLPMSILSMLSAVLSFKGTIGYGISLLAVFWCSFSASKLFVTALSLDSQRLLVAYPCALLYAVFALLAIF